MKNKNYLGVFLMVFYFGNTLTIVIDIKIEPKTIRVGDDLTVTCSVTDEPLDKTFFMFLRCSSNPDDYYCIKNCRSTESCTKEKCNGDMVDNQLFQCMRTETLTSLTFSYRFLSLSNSFINNRETLSFMCSYKGNIISNFVGVSKAIPEINPGDSSSDPEKTPEMISQLPNRNRNSSSFQLKITTQIPEIYDGNKNIESGILKLKDLILIGVLASLLFSFLINIWCCVQCCIQKSKNRKSQKRLREKQDVLSNNEIPSQYYYQDYIKRAKSQPNLTNNDKNAATKLLSNANNPCVLNYNQHFRRSTQTFEDFEGTNGSVHSLINPVYGQMVLAPLQCIDQSLLPFITPMSHAYSQNIPSKPDYRKHENNLDIFVEQETPDKQNQSLLQPLPKKPD